MRARAALPHPARGRAAEYELRAGALERLHRVTVDAFPGCGAEPLALFGSSATGLSLPASDLDVSAHVPHGGGRRKSPLDVLAKAVAAQGIAAAGTIQVLRHASVPILKFVEVRPRYNRARARALLHVHVHVVAAAAACCHRPHRAGAPALCMGGNWRHTHTHTCHWPPHWPAHTHATHAHTQHGACHGRFARLLHTCHTWTHATRHGR
eukprot:3032240-Prymnesium_polylepis.1